MNRWASIIGLMGWTAISTASAQITRIETDVCYGLGARPDAVFFSRYQPEIGCEVWTFDGEEAGLFQDITPGPESSYPHGYTFLGDQITLFANSSFGVIEDGKFTSIFPYGLVRGIIDDQIVYETGRMLFAYDGDSSRLVHDLVDFHGTSINFHDRMYFAGGNTEYGDELMFFDGKKVELAVDMLPGQRSSSPTPLGVVGDALYVTDQYNSLWAVYDDASMRIASFRGDRLPASFTEFQGRAYFANWDAGRKYGWEIWVTDDSMETVEIFVDLLVGSESSGPSPFARGGGDNLPLPGDVPFHVFDDKMWWYANDGSGRQLWSFDGTTIKAASADLKTTPDSEFLPRIVAELDGKMIYWAEDKRGEVWLYLDDTVNRRKMLHSQVVGLDPQLPGAPYYADARHIQYGVEFQGDWYFSWQGSLWRIKASSGGICDIDGDGVCEVSDIDLLTEAIRSDGGFQPRYDLNADGQLDYDDRSLWLLAMETHFGDANLDGGFDSTDLVDVFLAGQYEDDIVHNSTWATGDWDGDGDFTSKDIIKAFLGGGYEQGQLTSAATVPEPSTGLLVATALVLLAMDRRRQRPTFN